MTQNNPPPVNLETPRNVVSRPVGSDTVLTIIGGGEQSRGPWPFITGIPSVSTGMAGPPAQYLSVAGWAA